MSTEDDIEKVRAQIADSTTDQLVQLGSTALAALRCVKDKRLHRKTIAHRTRAQSDWDAFTQLDRERNALGALHQELQATVAMRRKAERNDRRESAEERVAQGLTWERAFVRVAKAKLTGERFQEFADLANDAIED